MVCVKDGELAGELLRRAVRRANPLAINRHGEIGALRHTEDKTGTCCRYGTVDGGGDTNPYCCRTLP